LRDVFKANGRTLTLLTTPGAVLPDELTQDVLVLDEPLPAPVPGQPKAKGEQRSAPADDFNQNVDAGVNRVHRSSSL
jgi:hypothetical protein